MGALLIINYEYQEIVGERLAASNPGYAQIVVTL